jgi:capsular polysaccharide biosynthesis protein
VKSLSIKTSLKGLPGVEDVLRFRARRPVAPRKVTRVRASTKEAIASGEVSGTWRELVSSGSRDRVFPGGGGWTEDRIFQDARVVRYPECFLTELKGASQWDYAVLSGESLLTDLSYEPGLDRATGRNHSFLRRRFAPRPIHVDVGIALCSSWADVAYYHWMIELLPRIQLLRMAGVSTKLPVFVNSLAKPFQRDTLDKLGIRTAIGLDGGLVEARTLLAPSWAGITADPPRWAIDFLRESFLPPAGAGSGPTRLYVSRADTGSRRVKNEKDLVAALASKGFVSVVSAPLSFAEQVEMFSRATHIVAPHGGGLTNIVFCNPDCRVVELFGPKYVNPCYWSLAELVGLDYRAEIAPGAREYLYDGPRVADDYEVDIERVLQAVAG